MPLAEIYARFGLAPLDDPTGNRDTNRVRSRLQCLLNADAVDDAFATHLQHLQVIGMVLFDVYRDPAEAERKQHLAARSFADDAPNVMISPAHGWWQRGTFNRYIRDLGPDGRADLEPIQALFIHYAVYDHNVLIQMELVAQGYQGEIPRLARFLHRLAGAILDEAPNHLVLAD